MNGILFSSRKQDLYKHTVKVLCNIMFKWRCDHRSGNCNLSNCKLNPKQFREFNGIQTHGLCVSTAVLYPGGEEGGVQHAFSKPLPHFRPKSVFFPTLFQTWSKIWYPISDLTLKTICSWQTVMAHNYMVGVNIKREMALSSNEEEVLLLKNVPNSRLECTNHTLLQTSWCSSNWAMKTHTLGAGQFVEFN